MSTVAWMGASRLLLPSMQCSWQNPTACIAVTMTHSFGRQEPSFVPIEAIHQPPVGQLLAQPNASMHVHGWLHTCIHARELSYVPMHAIASTL